CHDGIVAEHIRRGRPGQADRVVVVAVRDRHVERGIVRVVAVVGIVAVIRVVAVVGIVAVIGIVAVVRVVVVAAVGRLVVANVRHRQLGRGVVGVVRIVRIVGIVGIVRHSAAVVGRETAARGGIVARAVVVAV